MAKNIELIASFLFLFAYFTYQDEKERHPAELARKEAVISCFFDILFASEWSEEAQRGCMVRHGFLLEAKTDAQ